MPSVIRARMAKVCCLIKIITSIAVKARKPGISRRLCKIPISSPVKAALSTTKLLSNTCQVVKAIVLPMANIKSRVLRFCNSGRFIFLEAQSFNQLVGKIIKLSSLQLM